MITINNLSVYYDAVPAVERVSFNVAQGESFGLVGESGSGKSTILRALVGLTPAPTGELLLEDKPLHSIPKKVLAKRIQMVFQDPYGSLHPRFTVGRSIAEPMKIHKESNIQDRVVDLLEKIGLDATFVQRYPHELSGGQRQRVAIARALGLNPQVLLLDEPTSALDVSVQAEILNLLSDLRDEMGLTFIIVSHDIAIIAHMCERLLVMRHSKPLEILTKQQLLHREFQNQYSRELVQASIT